MNQTIIGAFSDREHANMAVDELTRAGFTAKDVSIVTKEILENNEVVTSTVENVAEGAVGGATTGGVIGGIAGLLIGAGTIAVPGIGGLLIGGPIALALGATGATATAVSAAVTGALAGGLVGGLIGLGVPQEVAQVYEERVRAGGVIIAVAVTDETLDHAKNILAAHGADQITTIKV